MEPMMPRRRPSFSLTLVALLLGLAGGAFGTIDPGNLKEITDYIRRYRVCEHYAVAVRLDGKYCNDSTWNLENALPKKQMQAMQKAINMENGLYDPNPVGNIVAARPKKTSPVEHAEWLNGQNSPVAKLKAKGNQNSGLVFFSKLSPCTERCLNGNNWKNIAQGITPLFADVYTNFKTFVFELLYYKQSQEVLNVWKQIKNVPLF